MPSAIAAWPSSSATAPCAWRATTDKTALNPTRRLEMKTSTFALVFGIVFLIAGLMGLVPLFLVPPPMDVPPTNFTLLYGYLVGLFPVNLIHTLMNIVVGAWGIAAGRGRRSATSFA